MVAKRAAATPVKPLETTEVSATVVKSSTQTTTGAFK